MRDSDDDDDGEACHVFFQKTCPNQEKENDDRGQDSRTGEDQEEDRDYHIGVLGVANLLSKFRNLIQFKFYG